MFVDLLEAVVKVDRSDIISNLIQHGSFLTNWLNFGRSAPLGRGFAWGQFFWLRLTTASARSACLRLSERFSIETVVNYAFMNWWHDDGRNFITRSVGTCANTST